ncbi:MFS transporter [Microbacterium thalassium]|uniref:CP family cyanate transporter-like MFS transporter n=1 Tax=Microbacterium thalassium TaxID=362649 RepID=A0A7X0KU31_9MICO|nr:MFS transporter [Microbacterium thalassium]MBB6390678.1 CP family cyanate transporter-like MFS transporter [Microbacterium thalassium]GLK25787.1 putative transporter YycB [Microbacterium thalassium]
MDIGVTRTRGATIALFAAVCLVAMNMRPTITAVGPLLDEIGTDTGLAIATLGLLASVPLAAWAIVSPFAHDLSQRFGMSRVVLWSLLLLTLGTAVRSLPGPTASLWIGTVLIGVALAIANVLMPAVVKRDFGGRVPLVMALYTGLLGGFGAIASGVAVPVSQIPLGGEPAGWRFSLLVTGGVLLLPAIVVWGWATRGRGHGSGRSRSHGRTGIWSDPVAWIVAAYMGLQSASFYMQVTWLATISTSTGRSSIAAGVDVMIYQIAAVGGALALPFALRGRVEALAPALLPILGIVGLSGLIVAPSGITGWVILTGLCSGASLGMSLTLMAQRARDHDGASALSGMSQSVGYVVAAIGPPVFGWLHAITAGWLAPLVLLMAVLIGQGIVGIFAGRERFVLEPR